MEDIRPTAKWANRMLRPLTSVYRRLEKHQETLSLIATSLRQKDEDKARAQARDADRTAASVAGYEDGCSYSECGGDDPSWIPGRREKRRIKHKYGGGRARRRNRLSIGSPEFRMKLPGAVEVATPLIAGKTVRTCVGSGERHSRDESPSTTTDINNDDHNDTEPSDVRKPGRSRESFCPSYQGSWKEALDMSGDTGLADIARFFDRILIKFLDNTRSINRAGSVGKSRGARSLLSMAARRLPEFIEDEQRIQDEQEDEEVDVDMCNVYFTELEAHYAPSGCGWKPLREAVRAQGIHLVSEILQKDWVTRLVARRLLELCLAHGHTDAFESILSRYLWTIQTHDNPTVVDSSHDNPARLLRIYYLHSRSGQRSFVFAELAKLLDRKAISPEWMVTTLWKRCVDGAIHSLSTEDDDFMAAKCFIEAVILAASGVYKARGSTCIETRRAVSPATPKRTRASAANTDSSRVDYSTYPVNMQDALNNLVLSLIGAICGMHLVRSYALGREKLSNTRMKDLIEYVALVVQREIEVRWTFNETDVPPHSLRRGYVLLGKYLLLCVDGSSPNNVNSSDPISVQCLDSFYLTLARKQDVVKDLAVLVRQVVCYYKRANKHEGTRTSQEVRGQIRGLMKMSNSQGLSTFLGKIAVETAMNIAEATLDSDDHVWAAEMQERFVSYQHQYQQVVVEENVGSDCQTVNDDDDDDDRSNNAGLYRWEEGIGEWVERTPVPKMKKSTQWNNLVSRPKVTPPRRTLPATPCSTSSSARGSSSPSVSSASSFTSSAPSAPPMSVKRGMSEQGDDGCGGDDDDTMSHRRPNKRRRSAPATTRAQTTKSNDWTGQSADYYYHSTDSETSANSIPRTAASYRVRRGAASNIDDLQRGSSRTIKKASSTDVPNRRTADTKGTERDMFSMQPTKTSKTNKKRQKDMNIEVVIVNRKEQDDSTVLVDEASVSSDGGIGDSEDEDDDGPKLPPPAWRWQTVLRSRSQKRRRREPIFISSLARMRTTPPPPPEDVDSESEDELSFLV